VVEGGDAPIQGHPTVVMYVRTEKTAVERWHTRAKRKMLHVCQPTESQLVGDIVIDRRSRTSNQLTAYPESRPQF
jgi:hypothetical protein